MTYLKKELNKAITEYEKLRLQFHDLGASGIVQGMTLKSLEENYNSFIGSYLVTQLSTDPKTDLEELKDQVANLESFFSLEGNTCCGEESGIIAEIFSDRKHGTNGYFYANPDSQIISLKENIKQCDTKETNNEKLLDSLTTTEKQYLIDMIRRKMESFTSKKTKFKHSTLEIESLSKIYDYILKGLIDPDNVSDVLNQEETLEFKRFAKQAFLASLKHLERDSSSYYTHLLKNISTYPAIVRIEIDRLNGAKWIGSHSFILYLENKNNMKVFQADLNQNLALGRWLNSEARHQLEQAGVKSFCENISKLESPHIKEREQAEINIRGISENNLQRVKFKVIPVDCKKAMLNIKDLALAAKNEFKYTEKVLRFWSYTNRQDFSKTSELLIPYLRHNCLKKLSKDIRVTTSIAEDLKAILKLEGGLSSKMQLRP